MPQLKCPLTTYIGKRGASNRNFFLACLSEPTPITSQIGALFTTAML
jgi:hypothetical protein